MFMIPSVYDNAASHRGTEQSAAIRKPVADFTGKDQLVFAVMDGFGAGKVAVEGRYGMIAFAENVNDLRVEIRNKVREYFTGGFQGEIYVRQFRDEFVRI